MVLKCTLYTVHTSSDCRVSSTLVLNKNFVIGKLAHCKLNLFDNDASLDTLKTFYIQVYREKIQYYICTKRVFFFRANGT